MDCVHFGSEELPNNPLKILHRCNVFHVCTETKADFERIGKPEHMGVCEGCNSQCATGQAPELSIVMPMFRRRDSVEMTVMALKLFHWEALKRCEIIVCDNEPTESEHGRAIKQLLEDFAGPTRCRYVPYRDIQGTAVGKQKAIEAAIGKAILCIDSHVMLPPGTIDRLLQWYSDHPETNDLYQGPLMRPDMVEPDGEIGFNGTHLDPKWSGGMYGVWGNDPRAKGDEPFEIQAQGMGLFSCRREAWPGFDSHSKGFGVEEFTTHAKFQRRGDKTILLPWLKWWHLFGHVDNANCGGKPIDRIENYVRSSLDTGVPEMEGIRQHFVEEMKWISAKDFENLRLSLLKPIRIANCASRGEATGIKFDCNCGFDTNVYRCERGLSIKRIPENKPMRYLQDGQPVDALVHHCQDCPLV